MQRARRPDHLAQVEEEHQRKVFHIHCRIMEPTTFLQDLVNFDAQSLSPEAST